MCVCVSVCVSACVCLCSRWQGEKGHKNKNVLKGGAKVGVREVKR